MIETVYQFTLSDTKLIERLVDDSHVNINHVVLTEGAALPEHVCNSNVYLIIVRGAMTIRLGEQDKAVYSSGSIVNIPYSTRMVMTNEAAAPLEFFIVKAPHPRNMPQ